MVNEKTAIQTRRAEQRAEQRVRDAEGEKLKAAWAKDYGLKASSRGYSHDGKPWRKLAGAPIPPELKQPGHIMDHTSLWLFGGKLACIVTQPYGAGGDELRVVLAFTQKMGLDFHIATWPAWHYPGHVLHIEFWNRELWAAVDKARQARFEKAAR